ncbi:MAG: hypothetical protein J5637_08945 [Prevotella sp.]|nr:hypothetical protein [Prevotella sp.]
MKKCLLGIAMLLMAGFAFAQESITVVPVGGDKMEFDIANPVESVEQEFNIVFNVSSANVLNLRSANFWIQIPDGYTLLKAYGNKLKPKYIDVIKDSSLDMLEATVEVDYKADKNVLAIALYHSTEDVGFPLEVSEPVLKIKLAATDLTQTGEQNIGVVNKPYLDGFEGEDTRLMFTTISVPSQEIFPAETQNPVEFAVKLTVGEPGYATLSWPVALDFAGTGLKASAATGVADGFVQRAEVTSVPAETPVIIEAAAGPYYLKTTADAPAAPATNILKGTATAAYTATSSTFALASKTDGVGFYRCKAGVEIPKYKAYIEDSSSAAEAFIFEETTGISNVDAEAAGNETYTISGVRVNQPTQKGMYIVNGKKVVVK